MDDLVVLSTHAALFWFSHTFVSLSVLLVAFICRLTVHDGER